MTTATDKRVMRVKVTVEVEIDREKYQLAYGPMTDAEIRADVKQTVDESAKGTLRILGVDVADARCASCARVHDRAVRCEDVR